VSFFETLAGHTTRFLRKLHQLVGSIVIIDESHASTPYRLYPQNERWMKEYRETELDAVKKPLNKPPDPLSQSRRKTHEKRER
jgi:hypothetical protein